MNFLRALNPGPKRMAIVLFVICALLRVSVIHRQGLWADEVFSLAMATGHSLEHAPDQADPSQGDYVELPDAAPVADYRKYVGHDSPPASPARVIRAVFKSDTSPPLYYLLLYAWTRLLGSGDASLRLFTVAAALACFPLIWWIGRRVGGTRAALAACVLYTISPTAIYYGTEGRMYALLWLFTLCSMAITVQIFRRGAVAGNLMLWVLAAAAGLMTHYFFAFVLGSLFALLMIFPGRASRAKLIIASVAVGLLVAPWYVRIPVSLAHWRVTDYWLNLLPYGFNRARDILLLPWSYFAVSGTWDFRALFWHIDAWVFGALAVLAIICLNKRLFAPRRLFLWLCIIAACAGLVIFDAWRKTYVVDCPRYALAGFPAAMLLAGFALAWTPKLPRRVLMAAIVLVCLVADQRIFACTQRVHPMREVAELLNEYATADDVVIISSIPSGVSGIARYMNAPADHQPMLASWVGQLKLRTVPDDLLRLAHGRKRIILVRMHEVWCPEDHEDWLWRHNKFTNKLQLDGARIDFFEPTGGGRF